LGFGAAAFTRFASEGWWARQDSTCNQTVMSDLAAALRDDFQLFSMTIIQKIHVVHVNRSASGPRMEPSEQKEFRFSRDRIRRPAQVVWGDGTYVSIQTSLTCQKSCRLPWIDAALH